jgi:hypothetical protein
MSGSDVLDGWERSSPQSPLELSVPLLRIEDDLLWALWKAWNTRYRPWAMAYGQTDRRALFVGDPSPKAHHSDCLRLHPARLGPYGRLVLEGTTRSFVDLDDRATKRAQYWATGGRLGIQKEAKEENP